MLNGESLEKLQCVICKHKTIPHQGKPDYFNTHHSLKGRKVYTQSSKESLLLSVSIIRNSYKLILAKAESSLSLFAEKKCTSSYFYVVLLQLITPLVYSII